MRRDPKLWTAEVWADVYGFALRRGEGWASRKDTYFVGKFRADNDPKDRFYPVDCKNPRECRVIEFLLPILYPEKPKRLNITMANTIFEALSGTRPVNWGDSSKNWWRSRSPTSARNPRRSPRTSSTSTNTTYASMRQRRMP